jgi:hypothetical protein
MSRSSLAAYNPPKGRFAALLVTQNECTTNAKSWYGRDRLAHKGLVAHRAEDQCQAAAKRLTADSAARTSTTMIRDEKCGLASGRAKTARLTPCLTPGSMATPNGFD